MQLRVVLLPLAMMIGAATSAAAAPLYFQGFETDTSGWTGSIARVASGGGTLGLTAYSGGYYAEVDNIDDAYQAGSGNAGYSEFGYPSRPTSYPGSAFDQSIAVYVNTATPAATNPSVPAFWIDASPSSTSAMGYGAEHNFELSYTGSEVTITADASTPLATLTNSGWYDFQFVYHRGSSPTSLVQTDLNVYNATGTLEGTATLPATSPGGPLESQDLGGPGYIWLTVWQNGFSNDMLGIDNVSAGTVPEPGTAPLLGAALAMLGMIGLGRRAKARRGAAGR